MYYRFLMINGTNGKELTYNAGDVREIQVQSPGSASPLE